MAEGSELLSKLEARRRVAERSGTDATDSSEGTPQAWQLGATELLPLQRRFRAVLKEREAAVLRKRKAESAVVAQTTALSGQIARLRIEVEMLRRDLELAQGDATRVRVDRFLELKRERRTREDVDECETRLQAERRQEEHLARQRTSERERLELTEREQLDCEARCRELEEQVARQILERMGLERALRESMQREREAEARAAAPEGQPTPTPSEPEQPEQPEQPDLDPDFEEPLQALQLILSRIRSEQAEAAPEAAPEAVAESDGFDVFDAELLKLEHTLGQLGGQAKSVVESQNDTDDMQFAEPLAALRNALQGLEPQDTADDTEPDPAPLPDLPKLDPETGSVDVRTVRASHLLSMGNPLFSSFVPLLGKPRVRV